MKRINGGSGGVEDIGCVSPRLNHPKNTLFEKSGCNAAGTTPVCRVFSVRILLSSRTLDRSKASILRTSCKFSGKGIPCATIVDSSATTGCRFATAS
jgi:hypothetical protein